MAKPNSELRTLIRRKHLYYWMVAKELSMTEGAFTRMLDRELDSDRKKQVTEAVDSLRKRMNEYGY